MKRWPWIVFCVAVGLLALWPAGSALAFSVSGRSSTELEVYPNGAGDTVVPAYEYLLLNVDDIDGNGLSFHGYGRLGKTLKGDSFDTDSHLYYAYLEKKNAFNHLDFRFGRQFIATTAGASLMDGLALNLHGMGPLSLKLFGGGDVAFYDGYNPQDLVSGTQLSAQLFKTLHLSVSYLAKWKEGRMDEQLFGFNGDYDFHNMLHAYTDVQYDYLTDSVSYFLGGLEYHPSHKWTLRSEYLYSLPVFSASSIYSVFAVDKYQQVMAELDYSISSSLQAFGRYTHEFYQEYTDNDVFEMGLQKIRTDRFAGYLSGVVRAAGSGSQDLAGVKGRVSYLFNRYLQAGVGAELDVLDRRITEEYNDTTSSRVWLDGTAYLTRKTTVQAKVERIESNTWGTYYQGRVQVNFLF